MATASRSSPTYAHQAPHDPYHLPKEWRSRHVGEYDKGWDAIRQERLKRQIELGIMPAGTQLAERMYFLPDPVVLAPASRAILGKKMELYAGMVENLDHHVGRLIDHLKKIGEYDNTIFIVFGDNGAEGTDLFKMIAGTPGTLNYLFAASHWSQTNPNAWGDPGSYVGYGPMWAQVSMTPFSQYKGWVAEGGIRNALIVSGPVVKRPKGSINHGLMHVGGHHADAALDCRCELSEDQRDGQRTACADGQAVERRAGGTGGIATDGTGLSRVGDLWQSRSAAGRLEAALAVQAVRHGRVGAVQRGDRSRRAHERCRAESRQGARRCWRSGTTMPRPTT